MTIDFTFRKIQEVTNNIPVVLIGTGASIPHSIPGMNGLADNLVEKLGNKYTEDASWVIISSRLEHGQDLESAVTSVSPEPSNNLMHDIIEETWKYISSADLGCFERIISDKEEIPLSSLIKYIQNTSKHHVNIIT